MVNITHFQRNANENHNEVLYCHFLLQEIFPTQGLNVHLLCLLHCMWILYLLSHQGSPFLSLNFAKRNMGHSPWLVKFIVAKIKENLVLRCMTFKRSSKKEVRSQTHFGGWDLLIWVWVIDICFPISWNLAERQLRWEESLVRRKYLVEIAVLYFWDQCQMYIEVLSCRSE